MPNVLSPIEQGIGGVLWHSCLPEGDYRKEAEEGYWQAFEKLAAVLEKER
jgi:hypothetical protein